MIRCRNEQTLVRSLLKRFTSTVSKNDGGPMRACIIGSGPAGFYSAYRLLSNQPDCLVDIYESLPVPYGLARFGVAPDHPEVKNVTHKFDSVATSSRFRFFGNVSVGQDIQLKDLAEAYDCILFAHGASRHKRLNVPGESLPGVMSARSFVGWYNGLPESSSLAPNLGDAESVEIIGQGNVALDIARILLTHVDALRKTDIADHALAALSKSKVTRVNIVGRRGPVQASFTIKEIRELVNLSHVTFLNAQRDAYHAQLATTLPRPQKRLLELLAKQESVAAAADGAYAGEGKQWDIQYNQSPTSFIGNSSTQRLEAVTYELNRLEEIGGQVKAIGTGELVRREAQLAFLSIGYQSEKISGMEDVGVIFDTHRHIIPNEQGRVTSMDGFVPGAYCSGWAKVGPVGVIASTMRDAFETADTITQDWADETIKRKSLTIEPLALIQELKKDKNVIEWDDWKRIEAEEIRLGETHDPPRPITKLTRMQDMIKASQKA